jgi:hypothetical protein
MILDSIAYGSGLGLLVLGSGPRNFGRQANEEERNFAGIANGFGGLAVSAYLLHGTANELGGFASLAGFMTRPVAVQSWSTLIGGTEWLLLTSLSALSFVANVRRPVARNAKRIVGQSAQLALGLWAWFASMFLPTDWIAPELLDVQLLNLMLACTYVFLIADAAAGLLVMLRSRPAGAVEMVRQGIAQDELVWRTPDTQRGE